MKWELAMNNCFLQENFSDRLGGNTFGTDNTVYKFEKIKRAKREAMDKHPGIELIDMGVGEPDDMAFPEVVSSLAEEAARWENRTYTDNGIDEFRNAVKRYMKELFNVDLHAQQNICHSIGSKSALTLIPACFINPGDLSIMTIPGYPVMGTWTKYLGGDVVNLPLTNKNNFFPDLESLSPDHAKRAKLLYLNYPNNPTGTVATKEFYQKAVNFALENKILIVSDAPYAALNFKGNPLSLLSIPGAMDTAIELHSMSKGFNMTGWRLGWVCGNSPAVNAFAHVKDNADSGQFAAIQKAAVKALENHTEITPKICEKYNRRLTILTNILNEIGFNAKAPEGSFFLYVNIPGGTCNGTAFESGEAFSQWLIKEKLISTVPWDDAGSYIRFSGTFIAKNREDEERVLNELKNRLQNESFVF